MFLMNHFLILIALMPLFVSSVFAESGVVELLDGSFGSVEIIDTAAVRDSSATRIKIKVNGVVSSISKSRISFIVFNNDTIFYRNLTAHTELVLDEQSDSFHFYKTRKLWISGSVGFSGMSIRGLDAKQKLLLATPAIRFFPAQDFFIGPRLQWTGVYSGVSSINQFGAGMDLGILGTGTSVVFYFRTGFLLNVQQYKSKFYERESSYAYGVSWPFGIGMLIRMNRDLYLQIEPGYQIKVTENNTVNQFSLSVGIAGIGRTYCVSTLHTLTNVYY